MIKKFIYFFEKHIFQNRVWIGRYPAYYIKNCIFDQPFSVVPRHPPCKWTTIDSRVFFIFQWNWNEFICKFENYFIFQRNWNYCFKAILNFILFSHQWYRSVPPQNSDDFKPCYKFVQGFQGISDLASLQKYHIFNFVFWNYHIFDEIFVSLIRVPILISNFNHFCIKLIHQFRFTNRFYRKKLSCHDEDFINIVNLLPDDIRFRSEQGGLKISIPGISHVSSKGF